MAMNTADMYETVALDEERQALIILDQTCLPGEIKMLALTDLESIWQAIRQLKVRGAPAIGVAAAIGLYLAARQIRADHYAHFLVAFTAAKAYLATARPTAVNLFWALDRMAGVVADHKDADVKTIVQYLHDEAVAIRTQDIAVCRSIGSHGLKLINDGDGILTHCNAGRLAAVRYGTALAPVYLAHEQGYRLKVYADETRPLLQGARLTSWELTAAGIDTTVICDNMASQVMKNGWVQAIFVGCDRMAANGDACNKIGTAGLAILARYYKVPFYVCLPTSTIDVRTATGKDIPIEQRDAAEITGMWYQKPMVAAQAKVYNPAFDVVAHDLISAIITEHGILYPPYAGKIMEMLPHT
jgi:methylthioribose-1-phosphate isomerase